MLDLYVAVTSKKPKPRAVVHAAQSFRLSRDILERIGKGEKFDVKDIVARHKNAVSDGFVAVVLKAVDNAYHALGRGGVRSTWLSAAPLVFVAAAASALYEKAGLLPVDPKHAPVADWALAGVPVLLTWLLAVHAAAAFRAASIHLAGGAIGVSRSFDAARAAHRGAHPNN